MKKAFTLIEMLIVVGIIAILVGASLAGFGKMMKSAEKAKAQELVSNVATALAAIYESDGAWPKSIRNKANTGTGILDRDTARVLGKRGYISMTLNEKDQPAGKDRFGIITPWATKVLEGKGSSASENTPVTADSTIQDHILHFAVDLDGDGIVDNATVGGEAIEIRATAAVWCIGKSGGNKGQPWSYSEGVKKDDVYSWTIGQTRNTK